MRALITGAAGQDGTLLAALLRSAGCTGVGTIAPGTEVGQHDFELVEQDIRDVDGLAKLISELQPDFVFHFAGITSVGTAAADLANTMDINVGGTMNLLTCVQDYAPAAHVVNATTVQMFAESAGPISEASSFNPTNAYATSKFAAFTQAQAFRSRGVRVSNAILGNHESELRPPEFVTQKIAHAVVRIAAGDQDELVMGDLEIVRDWSSARDVVSGMWLLAQLTKPTDLILASGKSRRLADLVDIAFNAVGISDWVTRVRTDPAFVRPGEAPAQHFDVHKAQEILGWSARTPPEVWLTEMVRHVERNYRAE